MFTEHWAPLTKNQIQAQKNVGERKKKKETKTKMKNK